MINSKCWANSGILIRDDDHYLDSFANGEGSHGEWTAEQQEHGQMESK